MSDLLLPHDAARARERDRQRERDNGAAEDADACKLLRHGQIVECKLVPWGSNYTFAVVLREQGAGEAEDKVGIYKPRAGEAPLWDFPDGTLYQREYAAWLVSQALGWDFIPETVIRDGPHGIGTVQRYVEPEEDAHYFKLRHDATHRDEFQKMALFDLVANNADRKAGHCFRGAEEVRIWGIDHGLTFNVQPKLRTIIWEFVGEEIPGPLRADLRRVAADSALAARLRLHLDPLEVRAFQARAERLAEAGVFPEMNPRRNIPYGW
jgi:uncharacterized repeat protein (TIGR03843 family)